MKPPSIEEALLRQLSEIESKIKSLDGERLALERLLWRARRENGVSRDVARKNSVTRILGEEQVIQALRQAAKPLSAQVLYVHVSRVVPNLNRSTFRTHLKRMRDKAIIRQRPVHGGSWELPV